ncbi:hypothetical protein H4R34_000254 [Dimargaris verticillata]|uniref:Uncharacterized protein n=1 Tax=Dimargaris verticillata TaxID=2761393 RepID=A0A9W8EC20_9FUNG|nr:hypothetical protein H4R34_000254 [Dimargaris verticillata]
MYAVVYLLPLAAITLWYLVHIWYKHRHPQGLEQPPDNPNHAEGLFWLQRLNVFRYFGHGGYQPTLTNAPGSFQANLESGFSSATFDLSENIASGDPRAGLERTEELQAIMKAHSCGFDKARKIYHQRNLQRHNIDPNTGIPLDPKAVVFGSKW